MVGMNEETFTRLLTQREGETLDFPGLSARTGKQELPGSSDLAVLISRRGASPATHL